MVYVSMNEMQTVRFTPSKDDYSSVLRLFFIQRTSTRLILVVLALAFVLICYVVLSQGIPPTLFELIWLFLPPLFVAYIFFIQPSRMASQAMQNEQLAAEATWEISATGVDISNRFGSTHLEWENLLKLVSTREYYLLLSKVNKNAFRFLPIRAFSSPQEREEFLTLVGKYLPVI
jgi:hypothetical protein